MWLPVDCTEARSQTRGGGGGTYTVWRNITSTISKTYKKNRSRHNTVNNLSSAKCFGFVSWIHSCGMNCEQMSEISFQNSPSRGSHIYHIPTMDQSDSRSKEESCRQNKWYCANWMRKKLCKLKKKTCWYSKYKWYCANWVRKKLLT